MLISFIRVTLLYLLVLFAIRVLGKRQISEYQPFELVVTMMIADIAAQPLSDVNTPLLNGVIPIVVFIFLQTTISFVTYKNEKIRKIICGKPEVLIEDGYINQKKMNDMLIGIDDLCEQLRNNDVMDLNEVSTLILEANGDPSIVKTSDSGLSYGLIKYGKRIPKNLEKTSTTDFQLNQALKSAKVKDDSEVFFAYVYDSQIYIIKKENLK